MNKNIICIIIIFTIIICTIVVYFLTKSKDGFSKTKDKIKIYLAGPMFTTGQRFENSMIAESLIMEGYTNVFLPQKSGIDDIVGLPQFLAGIAPFDKMDNDTKVLWGNYIWPIIYCLDINDLATSDAVVLNANGQCPDSGAMVEVGLASAMGKPIVIYFTEYDKTLNPMVAGTPGNFSIPSASNFKEVPEKMTQILKDRKHYKYKLSPNLKNYHDLGKIITDWKFQDSTSKLNQYDAFKSLMFLVTQGKGKTLMEKLTANPTTVSSTFKPEIITNNKNGTIHGTTFTAKLN